MTSGHHHLYNASTIFSLVATWVLTELHVPVVSREGNGEDVLGVSYEPAGGAAGLDLPQSEGSIPRPGPGTQ